MKYLALGDSYTIGESVPYDQNFPSQLIALMKEQYPDAYLAQLIAVTGWTTDELAAAIEKAKPSFDHDLVTLLIGVNNQYRGRSLEEYRWQFYSLLCQSILFAGGETQRVVVLSIPDWGLTPFNKDRDPIQTSSEIDQFNAINKEITETVGCRYVDVTTSSREHAKMETYLANDGLHYSGNEYKLWAEKIYLLLNGKV